MNKDRILWVVAVPFLICFVAPSIIGGLLIKNTSLDHSMVYFVLGLWIVFGLPGTAITALYLTRKKKPIPPQFKQ